MIIHWKDREKDKDSKDHKDRKDHEDSKDHKDSLDNKDKDRPGLLGVRWAVGRRQARSGSDFVAMIESWRLEKVFF